MVLRECPFCHRPLEAELLSKKQVDSAEATKVSDFPIEENSFTGQIMEGGFTMNRGLLILGPADGQRQAVAMHPEAFITYKLSYKCKHCGKTWTKLEVENKPLPREYVEEEEEKTDFDAHIEEEDAREDQYAREQ
jgi:hypothetical protein